MKFFLKGEIASSKNSKRLIRAGNKPVLIWSKQAERCRKLLTPQLLEIKETFLKELKKKKKPYKITLTFVRETRRRFDYLNIAQIVFDLMVSCGLLEDDNADIVIPAFKPYEVDKENAGVWIEV